MTTTIKDADGARAVNFMRREGSLFLWGDGFSYHFDAGVFLHQITREAGIVTVPREVFLTEASAA